MSSDATPLLSLPLILPAQAQKHVTHNESLRLLDILVHLAVLDRDRSAPPRPACRGRPPHHRPRRDRRLDRT